MAKPETEKTGTGSLASSPTPSPEHERLEILVGTWQTEGEIKESPSAPVGRLTAVDTYEWLPGGFFLLHRVDGRMGDSEVKATEIIGYDPKSESYPTWSFDNQGNVGTYQARLQGRTWTILGESERFTGTFNEDGKTLTGRWERSSDGTNWIPWMDVKLMKT